MAYPTFGDIVQDGITEAGLVTGSAVQTYTEPQLKLAVNRMFDWLFAKVKWKHLWSWQVMTLDPLTGRFTATLTGVKQWEDIDKIRITGTNGLGVARPVDNEHLSLTGGGYPLYWEPLPWDHADAETKFIQFYPLAVTGTVDVLCGHRPAKFVAADDVVPFDKTVISLGSLWYLLSADGINPAMADRAQGMFDVAYSDYLARIGAMEIGHGGGYRDAGTVRIQP